MGTRKVVIAAIVAFGLLAGPADAVAADDPGTTTTTTTTTTATATDAAFYAVPAPLPRGAPGDLIKVEPIDLSSRPDVAATGYRIMYHSRSIDGRDIAVTGLAAIPTAPARAGGRPIVDWAHGTYGTGDVCAPSKGGAGDDFFHVAGPVVAAGYLAVGTDYEGLGTPGLHPYLVGPSEGRAVLDAARAVRHLVDADASNEFAIWGHSQGGHATLWATQLATSYAPELHLVGSVPIAPASHVYDLYLFRQYAHDDDWAYLVMYLAGLHAAYPSADLPRVFTATGLASLGVVDAGCEDDVRAAYRGHDGRHWFTGDPHEDAVFGPLMDAQEPGQVTSPSPLLFLQGEADTTVPSGATVTLAINMCGLGQRLQVRTYPGLEHDTVLGPALPAALAWTTERFAGTPLTDQCPTLAPPTTAPATTSPASGTSADPAAPPAMPVSLPATFTG